MSDNVIKIVVSGDGGVGKTTLLHKYIKGKFEMNTPLTKGLELFYKEIEIEDKNYELMIWDLGGQKQFRNLVSTCNVLEGTVGSLVLFDLTRYITLNGMYFWLNLLSQHGEFPILIIGSKFDMINGNIKETDESVSNILEKHDNCFNYLKTSSLTGENV